ncbi:haloacetate dehalogenase [Frankineae bacterium MT45]|nr:haloacetate dehalogenase [Frankineae bacterium MT45]
MTDAVFKGFQERWIDVADDVRLRLRVGGEGPVVVLLHGHPRTHMTWHRVAPLLVASGHTVVCPDLRGYGRSTAPPPQADHAQASKAAMATDVVRLLDQLGHAEFAVVGHDRGSYVAHRTAMEHPDRITHLVALDSVPIGAALARADARFAQLWWHWFFFAQPEKPERAINSDPQAWYGCGPEKQALMGDANYRDFLNAIENPLVVRAMLEDYRAGLGVDRATDDADRAAGRVVECPTLVLWSTRDDMEDLYGDVLEVWRPWTSTLAGAPIESGHHLAEETPEELVRQLVPFLRTSATRPASAAES